MVEIFIYDPELKRNVLKLIKRNSLSEVRPHPETRARIPSKSSPAMEREGRRMVPISANY